MATEEQMIERVVTFLNKHGYYVWRQNNSGSFSVDAAVKSIVTLIWHYIRNADRSNMETTVRDRLKKCFRRAPNSVRGVADVIGWDKQTGKWIVVEIKTQFDKLSPEQELWLKSLKKAGGEVYLVRDVDLFQKKILEKIRA
jgi:hypothetical protein